MRAAHPCHHAGFLQGATGETRQDDIVPGRHDVSHDPEEFHLEFFDFVPFKYCPAHALEAGSDLLNGEKLHVVLAPQRWGEEKKNRECRDQSPRTHKSSKPSCPPKS